MLYGLQIVLKDTDYLFNFNKNVILNAKIWTITQRYLT